MKKCESYVRTVPLMPFLYMQAVITNFDIILVFLWNCEICEFVLAALSSFYGADSPMASLMRGVLPLYLHSCSFYSVRFPGFHGYCLRKERYRVRVNRNYLYVDMVHTFELM